ncbi:WbqC family protein [Aeromonas salmonicida]|uniref:WbqC family protein n=1 Tax=Aeromonas salmonicida TaxID=645 RepID=UPI00232DA39B|nr:WbqC family protein [Aeromonas salmonicida]WCH22659.1 WbqC family protein [Aeromonas salmonicida]
MRNDNNSYTVVVSQPMYFPWIGLFQQINRCDAFVFYDDVQFTRGFFNRVQLKNKDGIVWLTVPLMKWHRGARISDVQIDNTKPWQSQHLNMLQQAFSQTRYGADVMDLVQSVFSRQSDSLSELAIVSTKMMCQYFGLETEKRHFSCSSSLNVGGKSSERLIEICQHFHASEYLTGHGARHYLSHEQFENVGLQVNYIDYTLAPYPQHFGDFTPYVTALDAIAHLGSEAVKLLPAGQISWRAFSQ